MWRRLGPSRWRGGLREIAIILSVYGAYWLTRGSLPHREVTAGQNALELIDLEDRLGFFCELDIQSWFLSHPVLVDLANAVYTYFYYPVIILFALWVYNRHREKYAMLRNVFLVSAALGFLCFAFYPVTPPRLLPQFGFVDTMAQYGSVDYGSSFFRTIANPYAAMPSLHFGWVLLVGIGTIYASRVIFMRMLGVLVPLAMLVAIVATGNHFIIDAVGGALTIGLACGLVLLFARWRSLGVLAWGVRERREAQE